jgi:hypothetical protein
LYQGVEKESFGYKLLANLGWKEGQGLVRAALPEINRHDVVVVYLVQLLLVLLSAPCAIITAYCVCELAAKLYAHHVTCHGRCCYRVQTSKASRNI